MDNIGLFHNVVTRSTIKLLAEAIDRANSEGQMQAPVICSEANQFCENCKYYSNVTDRWGNCKFYPPYIRKEQRYKYYAELGQTDKNLVEDICHTERVHTYKDSYCGQFEQREPNGI